MNLTKLKNNQIQLIEFMRKRGYSKHYIKQVRIEIDRIIMHGENYGNYYDYYNNFICNKFNKKYYREKRTLLTLIMNFDLYDQFPNRTQNKTRILNDSSYAQLNKFYKNIINTFIKESERTDKKETTIHNESMNCSCFLLYLQKNGHDNLEDVKENDIISFFVDENGTLKFSQSYIKNIKIVLKKCIGIIDNIQNLVDYLPNTRNIRKNIDYLTNEEISQIKEALVCESDISLRDKAIISLLLYTGLRSCDIANLELNDIDWNNETINIVQKKTNTSLELPLTASIGNAIYEYIQNERSNSTIENIFLREDADMPITSGVLYWITSKLFKKLNLRQDGKRKGTHIFRYNLATTLLKNEIPQPIISQILGHSSSESIKHYLSADFYHLKQCSLNIEPFENILKEDF